AIIPGQVNNLTHSLAKTPCRWLGVLFASLFVCFAFNAITTPAQAQLQRAAPAQSGRPPAAAPVGPAAESVPLVAPPGSANTARQSAISEIQSAFTPVGLFVRADIVVKSVLLLLILASFWTWVLIIDKSMAFGSLKRKDNRFETIFCSGRSLDE